MKIKNIISAAAFSTAFISSAAFAGLFIDKSQTAPIVSVEYTYTTEPTSCFAMRKKSASAERISAFVERDIRNGFERDKKLYAVDGAFLSPYYSASLASYSAATTEYTDASGSLDADRLPQEFQAAWRAHMKAWRVYADFLEDMNDSATRNTLGEESFKNLDKAYDAEISRTWYEVLRVADEYGAN